MTCRSCIPFLPLLALLAACAPQGSFPSLAPRPIEQLAMDEPVRAVQGAPDDPELRGRIDTLLTEARRGSTAFAEALPEAVGLADAAGAPGSESWIEAQQALSRLEAARATTLDALTELDRLGLAGSENGRTIGPGDFETLRVAAEEARRLADSQQSELDRLRAALGAP